MKQTTYPIKILVALVAACSLGFISPASKQIINHQQLAGKYYGSDSQWYLENIPFFECADKTIEEVYYYRWNLYKAHIRNVGGEYRYVVTEFIDDVDWDDPLYSTINAAAGHHILEGRWLKDNRYLNGYINFLYRGGGNDCRYSENVAAATYARFQVNADAAFVESQLGEMKRVFGKWDVNFVPVKKLYYIKPDRDATEYSIASLEASGGKDGWGGEAFRPSINSYMYANALAISRIAYLQGDKTTGKLFAEKAAELKTTINLELWSNSLGHYMDRFQVNNDFVKYWDFIPGRELAGYVPWQYNIPEDNDRATVAWKHLTDATQFAGKYGIRTVEPSYKYYMIPFRYKAGETPECQWNGPSWPYQTAQVLSGMANVLNNYSQDAISASDYVHLLHQYAKQHYTNSGVLDLQEDCDPDNGGPLVGLPRSHHYNHSTYNDLVISGLCGLHPSEGDTLEICPLVDKTISYFCLSGVQYHGHELMIAYDTNGKKYKLGKGLTVLVDGKKAKVVSNKGKFSVQIGSPVLKTEPGLASNLAVNLAKKAYPAPTASVNNGPDSLYKAIDGRTWYFTEHDIRNRWSTVGSTSATDWYALDFGQAKQISKVNISLYADGKIYGVPDGISIEYNDGKQWLPVKELKRIPAKITGNTTNAISFERVTATGVRVTFKKTNNKLAVALVELECY